MHEENEDWYEEDEPRNASKQEPNSEEVQKMLLEIDRKTKNHIRYLILEGFIETTDNPKVFKYTPEGLVMVSAQYKKLKEEGLI